MKKLKSIQDLCLSTLRGWLMKDLGGGEKKEAGRGNGQSLLRLHEYQHKVIVEIFRVSIAGFFGFTLILTLFAVYALFAPSAPSWMSVLVVVLCFAMMVAIYRTVQEFQSYRKNYQELTQRLRAKLQQQTRAYGAQATADKPAVEHRLLSALKPKEHAGWDHKSCTHCKKAIELLARVCQHCGHEQDTLHIN